MKGLRKLCKQVPWTVEVYKALDLLSINNDGFYHHSTIWKTPEKLVQAHSLVFRISLAPLEFCILKYSELHPMLQTPSLLGGLSQTWSSFRVLNSKYLLPVPSCHICVLMLFWASLDLIFCLCFKTYLQERAWSPDCRFLWAAEAASSPLWFLSIRERDKALFSFPQHASPQRLPPRILLCWKRQE